MGTLIALLATIISYNKTVTLRCKEPVYGTLGLLEGMQGKTNLEAFQALQKMPLSHRIARRLACLTGPAGVCTCWANHRQPPTQWRCGSRGVSYLGVGVPWKSRLALGEGRGSAFRA